MNYFQLKQWLFFLLFTSSTFLLGQENPDAAQIRQQIKKLKVLGSVLYLAAHPDDENTRIIAYMANGRLYETAYLALTRGDGGQNLLGNEKGDLMGVIRTQELLEARKIDAGQQFFTNSVDFGYTRSQDETIQKWGLDSVLMDVTRIIRTFHPDVIILRFPPDERAGHGHHQASATIARMAVDYASAPMNLFENPMLSHPWIPKRVYINTGKWWVPNIDSVAAAHPEKYMKLDVGGYNGLLGKSYTEIAGMSRSQHKTQGFGASLNKGQHFEYLELLSGEPAFNDLMDGITTDWTRLGPYENINELIDSTLLSFNDEKPWEIIPLLFSIRNTVLTVEDEHWKNIKLKDIDRLIADCLGLAIEVISPNENWIPGSRENLKFDVINRSPAQAELISVSGIGLDSAINFNLQDNRWFSFIKSIKLPINTALSNPYWLRHSHDDRFIVADKMLTGLPEINDAPIYKFIFKINEHQLTVPITVIYRNVDRVKGELKHPVFIAPRISIHPESESSIFRLGQERALRFLISSHRDSGTMEFYPNLPENWHGPESVSFAIDHPGQQTWIEINITAPDSGIIDSFFPYVKFNNIDYNRNEIVIRYNHIEPQMLTPQARVKMVSVDLHTVGSTIAYVKGAGDEVPKMLEQLGYHISYLKPEDLKDNIGVYESIIFGVRAFNVHPELENYHEVLMKYVKNGGNVVMQYNTSRGLTTSFGPYPFKLSRDRITDENAPVIFNSPTDSILNYPNKIEEADFEGWVQERGLYFSTDWNKKYRTPIGFESPEGKRLNGSLLITNYGSGTFVYTSLAFFRELPAGVPGAYRLFANIIAGGKENKILTPKKGLTPLEKD